MGWSNCRNQLGDLNCRRGTTNLRISLIKCCIMGLKSDVKSYSLANQTRVRCSLSRKRLSRYMSYVTLRPCCFMETHVGTALPILVAGDFLGAFPFQSVPSAYLFLVPSVRTNMILVFNLGISFIAFALQWT